MTPAAAASSTWPYTGKWRERPVNCAALFIDIRGSSELAGEAGTVARRTRCFLEKTKELWEPCPAPSPSFVKSVGDGLFCVWELPEGRAKTREDLPKDLINSVLQLYATLPGALGAAWEAEHIEDGKPVELGMGLAFGEAMRAMLGDARDYYGYVINLAAKLQNLARPRGVVIQSSGSVRRAATSLESCAALRAEEYPLAMAPNELVECLVTQEVNELHKWTCLAWPGFGGGGGRDERTAQGGLNAKGITVLTHEGLAGKIDTLQIWPRNGSRKAGSDRFEFIIDDFDSLQAMSSNQVVSLHRPYQREDLIAPALATAVEEAAFDFIPIRCGLNAIAWHTTDGAEVPNHKSYRETIEHRRDNSDFRLAMYDNVGASLPVLINAFCPDETDIFSIKDEKKLEHVITELTKCQRNASGPLFRLYERIDFLAHSLQVGRVHAVLGGGAWLASVDESEQDVASHIPAESYGFLWIEGAALLTAVDRNDTNKLRQFLRGSVLADAYQDALMNGLSYCSCPVTRHWIDRILSEDEQVSALTPARRLIYEDTKAIFRKSRMLSQKIRVRTLPALAGAWETKWNQIKADFCHVVGGKLR